LITASAAAQVTPEQKRLDLESFEKVWSTVRDKHWEEKPGGLDWQAIHTEFRPRAEQAKTTDELRTVIREMLGRLNQTHFGIISGSVYSAVEENRGEGTSGIDLRVLNGAAIVTSVEPESGAAKAGVKPGWQVVSVEGREFTPVIERAKSDPTIHEMQLTRSMAARLTGTPGASRSVMFRDATNQSVSLTLPLVQERGQLVTFGNLPPQRVTMETKRIGGTAYFGFSMFLDLVHVLQAFQKVVEGCAACDGLVIDLRGNPGGLGGMAMGIAGFLIDTPDQKLGTMYMRDATLKFVVNPRPEVYGGPVAILVDGLSASTSEILGGGLKDLGRARIFGTRTAAAALPSAFEKLPNGDGFQYAVANYISEGGKPLEGLGLTPDQEIRLTREALLAGRDPVLEGALDWIRSQKK
jgi:carboxyl-terminal processing protease